MAPSLLQDKLHSLTHGSSGLALAYLAVALPMLGGLLRGRAPVGRLMLWPLLAIPVAGVAAIALSIAIPLMSLFGMGREGPLSLACGMLVSVAVGYATGLAIGRHKATTTRHRRGAVVSDQQSRVAGGAPGRIPRDTHHAGPRAQAPASPDSPVTLAGVCVATGDETKHFKLIGTTGTGKSTAICELLDGALARGDRAVVADPDGGYLARFHDPARGDIVLNPFNPASLKWDPFSEITNDYDVDQLARSLIPDNGDSGRSWSEYARTFLIAVIQQARAARIQDVGELYNLLTQAPLKELRLLLNGTAAGPFVESGNEKMFGSIRSVTSSAVRALHYIAKQQAPPFCVRQWVRQGAARSTGGTGGVLFFPYKAGEIAALRSTIAAWLRIAIFEAMDRGAGDQRLWFIVDELDALGEIDGLKDALARLRKFGGRCVLGFQSIAQVSGTYGRSVADTLVENCGNTLILRCSASEQGGTSQFASKLIGQREVLHTTRSRSRRALQWLGSTTTSEHISIEPAVMPSEIERLPDLAGFLKLASIPDWRRVTLPLPTGPSPGSGCRSDPSRA